MTFKHEELDSLLLDWEAGTLDEQGVKRVREILKSDPDAREHFVQMQMLSASLKLEQDAGLGAADIVARPESSSLRTTTANSPQNHPGQRVSRRHLWMIATAAAFALILGGRLAYLEFDRREPGHRQVAGGDAIALRSETEEATSTGIALVTRVVDVAWGQNQQPLDAGDALVPGRLAIESGLMQVEFFCGATVILEGPAELDLESAMLARVHSGRLRAQVPPAARGFSINIADMKVVDLGTEFGLSVSPQGADVQVFDGEVELHRPEGEKRLLTAGQAVVRNAEGAYADTEISPEDYIDIAMLESRERGQQTARLQRWKSWSEELRNDPRLIAYYTFDQQGGWNRKLKSSVEPLNDELDGAIVGAGRVRGRWLKKSGLEFKRPGDRVRVQIPGEFESLTLACWTKIDSLDRTYNSLFLTDNYNQGEPHWQILDTGQLFFSVRWKADGDLQGPDRHKPTHQKVLSPPFWQPSMSGKWMHLATTYDVPTRTVTHYLNGEHLHSEVIPEALAVKTTRIGAASIGNWSLPTKPDAQFAIRNLNGSIDEFALFAAALSADEIQEMFRNGKP